MEGLKVFSVPPVSFSFRNLAGPGWGVMASVVPAVTSGLTVCVKINGQALVFSCMKYEDENWIPFWHLLSPLFSFILVSEGVRRGIVGYSFGPCHISMWSIFAGEWWWYFCERFFLFKLLSPSTLLLHTAKAAGGARLDRNKVKALFGGSDTQEGASLWSENGVRLYG